SVFIQTIPFNLYALLTLGMVFILCAKKFDFFRMNKHESLAVNSGNLTGGYSDLPNDDINEPQDGVKGKVRYMVAPIIALVMCCIGAMIYTGYFFDGEGFVTSPLSSNIIEAFSNCNAGISLAIGSTITVIATFVYYLACKVISFDAVNDTIVDGFKSMVSAILILTLAWTLSGIMGADGGGLEAAEFIRMVVDPSKIITALIPAVLFLIAVGISFSTGTSWGTFGILIPIATAIIGTKVSVNVILTISAVLAGAVVGDHISPISDTTILSSSGAQCNHVEHVNTQMPYALLVAGISLVSYIIVGFIAQSGLGYWSMAIITLSIGFGLLLATLISIYFYQKRKGLLHKEITRKDIETK
ncbi:MAG: Na+/H+ antiporter NhaC family protein, partial [Clostridia bacterium]